MEQLTLAVLVCIKVKTRDVVSRDRLDPDTLPDTTAGGIEDVARIERLLANWNDIRVIISRVMDENEPVLFG